MTTSIQDLFIHNRAWAMGQKVSVHGWAFGVHDGLLHDLNMTVTDTDSIESLYQSALESVIAAHR